MAEWLAGDVADFDDEQRRIVSINGRDIVVFRHRDRFYALDNVCRHMGGPVGEGVIMGKVEAVISPDRCFLGERFSEDEIHIVCPWHGWEYDIETGEFAGDKRIRLRRYETELRGNSVYVRT